MPGRARHPVPASPPRGSRVVAACAVVLLVVQLLFAQLTLVLALLFVLTGRVSRWRLGWLAGPAAVGVGWALALGPARAVAGFAAGPAHVLDYLDYLGRGRLATGLSHPSGAFAGAGSWLPRQLPIALITGAAEAALIGSLGRLRIGAVAVPSSGPSAVSSAVSPPSAPPRRPGAIAAGRAALAGWLIRSGSVVTRDGCALGVAPGTGAVAELRWSEVAGGILVTGAEHQDVTVASLQVVHAALRRRKPLIVIDASADAAITRALTAACAATGTPLHRVGLDLAAVIGERSAALVRVGSAELAARACADIAALADGLRRIGVDGDGLIWVTDGERLPADAVAALIGDGRVGGLAVLIGTSSPAAAARLAGLVEARLILRVADPSLAAILAVPTSGQPVDGGPPVVALGISAGLGGMTAGAEPASRPAVSASGLLSLGPGEFVLTVGEPVPRTITLGRLVPARLPRPAVGRERGWRRLRLDPA